MGKKFALVYLVVLTLVMGGALAYGFIVGDFWEDGGELMDNPWGIVSLFDVYVGFFFFIGWIVYRESCPGIILAWSVAIHCEPVTEPHPPCASFETRWIAASLRSFLAMTGSWCTAVTLA